MPSALSILVGKKIVEIDMTPQDGGVMFEEGITLNIYNSYEVTFKDPERSPLTGSIVVRVEETTEEAIIVLDNGVCVKVALTSDAYFGPEAMQLRVPGKSIVIWS
ncbi:MULTISPECIES: hypothetical protein [Cupriavidus]|jgi:hypothetical protein|uniref:hypothetical protein n=1 Tax=Cupriavidus TaxID=106589 RepID=UPI001160959D|nr:MULTISPECIES: hypothetical protein [Cupriavidus]